MSVYIRWYGSIVQGEVVENQEKGILGGLVAVRIQVQGMKATALFAPAHVYQSEKDALEKEDDPRSSRHKEFVTSASGNSPEKFVSAPKVAEKPREISRNEAEISIKDLNVLQFKQENWDHERNHLRIDKLDEFYEIWKASCAPIFKPLKVEGNLEVLAEEFKNYDGVIYNPEAAVTTLLNPEPKPIVSDNRMAELRQQLKKTIKPVEAKQLSLFD